MGGVIVCRWTETQLSQASEEIRTLIKTLSHSEEDVDNTPNNSLCPSNLKTILTAFEILPEKRDDILNLPCVIYSINSGRLGVFVFEDFIPQRAIFYNIDFSALLTYFELFEWICCMKQILGTDAFIHTPPCRPADRS